MAMQNADTMQCTDQVRPPLAHRSRLSISTLEFFRRSMQSIWGGRGWQHQNTANASNNIKLKTLEGSYSKAPLNWLELHCEHFSDWVDTIKLRTNLELNTGDRREPYQSPMCGLYYKSVSVPRLALNTTISPGLSIVTTMTLTPLPSVRLFGGLFTPHQPLYWVLSASKSFVWTPHILSFAPFSVTNRRIALDQWQPSGNLCKPTENAGSVQTTKLTHIATIHFL